MDAGVGRRPIDVFEPGMPMLGWGVDTNVAERFGAPLHARAFAVREGSRARVLVLADLCFITAALRVAVLDALRPDGLGAEDVTLLATHTHRGPNGYSHAFFYDLSALGFSPRVFDALVGAIAGAARDALARLVPATLHAGEAAVPASERIAFNRSLAAYLENPEATREPAVDPRVLVIEARDLAGRALGLVSFFASHATLMHSDATSLHPDHKGLAARALEARRGEGFVALFAQGAAGDVTPNHRFCARRGFTIGRFDDDEDSARHAAEVQVAATERALETASRLDGPLDAWLTHVDLEALGEPARLGAAMAAGTREGPGPVPWLAPWLRRPGPDPQDPKRTLLRVGPGRERRLFGRLDPSRVPLPHPAFAHARRAARAGTLSDEAWISTVLPLSVLRFGEALAIVTLPNEPSTCAGRRIARRLAPRLGVRRVQVAGYANAYSGYLTTPEEYALQRYEGAYTLFGPRTLDLVARSLEALVAGPPGASGPPLQTASPAALEARRFVQST